MAKNEAVLSVGFNNFVIRSKIVAITAVNTSPIKKDIKVAKEQNRLIDATMGKRSTLSSFSTATRWFSRRSHPTPSNSGLSRIRRSKWAASFLW